MRNKKQNKTTQAIFFFMVMLAVSSLALYDGEANASRDDNNILMRVSAGMVNTAAKTVDNSMKLLINDRKMIGEALGHFKQNHPEKAHLLAPFEREIGACPTMPQVNLYCIAYDYRTKEMDSVSLQNAQYITELRPNSPMKGCFQKSYAFRVCIFEEARVKTESL